jgi:hypothetical protein
VSPNARWLPSDSRWIDQVIGRLIDGDIVLVRGLPRTGKSAVCDAVSNELGASGYLVVGSRVDEANQGDVRERIESEVMARIALEHSAQLIFDDYGKAIRRSQGGRLHSFLYRLLVDGPNARDTGALLTSRYGDDLDLRFAGSPLLSRAQVLQLPETDDEDAAVLGMDLSELRTLAGSSTAFARRMLDLPNASSTFALVEYLNADRSRLAQDLPPEVIEVLLGARAIEDLGPTGTKILEIFGTTDGHQGFEPARCIVQSAFLQELKAESPGWPSSRAESVDRFANLLAGAEDALWVDRYLFAKPAELSNFLHDLRARTDTHLRLLGSDDLDNQALTRQVGLAIGGLNGVEARTMTRSSRRQLHDLHLVLPMTKSGFVLPTAGVITSCDHPGSAVCVRMPGLPVNYGEYWRRATQI